MIAEWQTFQQQVSGGTLYQYMHSVAQVAGLSSANDQAALKEMVNAVMSGDVHCASCAEGKAILKQSFPQLYQVIETFEAKYLSFLIRLLKAIQAEIIFNRIAQRITAEQPALPLFIVGPSIVTTSGNEAYVEQVMKEELQKAIGIVPYLTRSFWSEYLRMIPHKKRTRAHGPNVYAHQR
ncbi:hypothetical protein GCM10023189_32400 [Nibrella saemangeumensis]|uniref:Uncharacterized protein n=2 Tax=Nibrella saemangeumensis TaxID=1084526 RepID=A0ABP8N0E6_9BACT